MMNRQDKIARIKNTLVSLINGYDVPEETILFLADEIDSLFESPEGVVGKPTHTVTNKMESICEECNLEMTYRDGEGSLDGFVGWECHGCLFSYPA